MEASIDTSSVWLKLCLSIVKSKATRLINKHIGQYPFYLDNNINAKVMKNASKYQKRQEKLKRFMPIMH